MSNDTEVYEAEPLPPIKYDVTEAGLATLREQASTLPAVVESTKDRQACVSVRKEVRSISLAVEARRVELKKDALEYGRRVDAIAKRITASIREIEDPIGKRIDAYDAEVERRRQEREEAERQRIQEIQDRIARIAAIPSRLAGASSTEIQISLEGADGDLIADDFAEFLGQAEQVRIQAIEQVRQLLVEAQERERREAELVEERKRLDAERAELEAQRAAEAEARQAQEETDRVEREKRLAEEAEARRIEEEERLAQREKEQQELERQRAELAAQQQELDRQRAEAEAKAAAEREAKEEEERRQRAEEERKQREAQDLDRRNHAHDHITDALLSVTEDIGVAMAPGDANELVSVITDAIIAGGVPHVRFEIDEEVLRGS